MTDRAEPLRSLLAGCWRDRPPPAPRLGAGELAVAAGAALATGSGALAWWTVRASASARTPAAVVLKAAHVDSCARAAANQRLLANVLRACTARRIPAIAVKGWAVARLYPAPGLRAYRDVDLLVPREHLDAACRARDKLVSASAAEVKTDRDVSLERRWAELAARARTVPLGDVAVPVLGPEDTLRLACLHGLRHGFGRPVWLCDVALLMERLPEDADWEYLLAGPAPVASWVRLALALAAGVLGASAERVPRGEAPSPPPAWVRTAVLAGWTRRGRAGDLASVLRSRPWTLLAELRARWPDPLVTLHRHRRAAGGRPPVRLQARDSFGMALAYAAGRPRG